MTRFRKVLIVLNELKRKRLVKNYAIGGGVSAFRYTHRPTKDLDVFISIQVKGLLVNLAPVYSYLRSKGYCRWVGQWLDIEGYPTEFIVSEGLKLEAIYGSLVHSYEGVRTRMMRPEYLIALALESNRIQDRNRVRMLLAMVNLDMSLLTDILKRYSLEDRFSVIKRNL